MFNLFQTLCQCHDVTLVILPKVELLWEAGARLQVETFEGQSPWEAETGPGGQGGLLQHVLPSNDRIAGAAAFSPGLGSGDPSSIYGCRTDPLWGMIAPWPFVLCQDLDDPHLPCSYYSPARVGRSRSAL